METKNLTFSDALHALKAGSKVCREGWNGKGMWLVLAEIDFYSIIENKVGFDIYDKNNQWTLCPWIVMKTADNKFVPWLASQTDILEEDWVIL
jgi:hypothetical protein